MTGAPAPEPMNVVPLQEHHFLGLYQAFDTVARERRFLAFLAAPPLEQALAFYRDILANDGAHFVALDGRHVVGWCDVLPARGQSRAHVGVLGIALLAQARGHGLGSRLMDAAIAKAWSQGITRIELTVRADNQRARALYERKGFEVEGLFRRAFRVEGEYIDSHAMALLRPAGGQSS